MSTLVLEPTDMAQWHALVCEAQAACQQSLDEPVESYLVFLLMRFVERADLAARVMALEFLRAQQQPGQRPDELREIGDQCLLFSGLFPQIAERRLVRVSYFVDLGRTAYQQAAGIADRHSDGLYRRLAQAFVAIMDVLQAMRGLSGQPALASLAAAELWADTGSRHAFRLVSEQTGCPPAAPGSHSRRRH
jgi:hypothetical protein